MNNEKHLFGQPTQLSYHFLEKIQRQIQIISIKSPSSSLNHSLDKDLENIGIKLRQFGETGENDDTAYLPTFWKNLNSNVHYRLGKFSLGIIRDMLFTGMCINYIILPWIQ